MACFGCLGFAGNFRCNLKMRKLISNFMKKVKEFNILDIGLTKLSLIALILLVLNLFPDLVTLVETRHWAIFLLAAVIFALKPLKKILFLFRV